MTTIKFSLVKQMVVKYYFRLTLIISVVIPNPVIVSMSVLQDSLDVL